MPKKVIEIKIIGGHGTGKSNVAYFIAKMLESLDFEVDHKLDMDYVSKFRRSLRIEPNLPEALFTIKDKTKIVIKEEQSINPLTRNNNKFL